MRCLQLVEIIRNVIQIPIAARPTDWLVQDWLIIGQMLVGAGLSRGRSRLGLRGWSGA
jgi:hypothetical protein